MPNEEMLSKTGLVVPGPKRAAMLFGRALLLRCPNCGRGPVLKNWLKLRERCGTCGLRLERGEHDYFTGSMLFNFILSSLVFLGALVVIMVAAWPNVPWDALQIVLPVLMLGAPIAFFPFSKLTWLAFDLMLRPVNPDELTWHRTTREEFSSEEQTPTR